MVVSPSLPWGAGGSGTITLRTPLTLSDLENGALQIVDTNGVYLVPERDGLEIAYHYPGEIDHVASIIYDEDTGLTEIEIDTDQTLAIGNIILMKPAGDFAMVLTLTPEGEQPPQDSLVVFAANNGEDAIPRGLLTQDGVTVIAGEFDDGVGESYLSRVFDNNSGVNVGTNITLRHISKPTSAALADLPLIPVRLQTDDSGNLELKILYQPNELETIACCKADGSSIKVSDNYTGNVYI